MARSLADIPEFPLFGDADPHAYLKELRAVAPFARAPMGIVFALRHRHLDLVTSDATRLRESSASRRPRAPPRIPP